jgi:hypothetical protein
MCVVSVLFTLLSLCRSVEIVEIPDDEVIEEVKEEIPLDPESALKMVLRTAMIHDTLARGLHEAVKGKLLFFFKSFLAFGRKEGRFGAVRGFGALDKWLFWRERGDRERFRDAERERKSRK